MALKTLRTSIRLDEDDLDFIRDCRVFKDDSDGIRFAIKFFRLYRPVSNQRDQKRKCYVTDITQRFKSRDFQFHSSQLVDRRRATEIAEMKKQERTEKIIKILSENNKGLTAIELKRLMDVDLPRSLLVELQKVGVIRQAKGMADDGRILMVYRLARNHRAKEK